jgi:hypothetical protein
MAHPASSSSFSTKAGECHRRRPCTASQRRPGLTLLIPWMKHPLNRAIFSAIYLRPFLRLNHRLLPPPRPLYKGGAPPCSTTPLPAPLLFSLRPSIAHTEHLHHHFFTAVVRSPRCRPRPGEARDGLPMLLSLRCAIAGEPSCPRAAIRPSSGEVIADPLSTVRRGPAPPWSTSYGPGPCSFSIRK